MLRNLGLRIRVDDSELRSYDDVRNCRVGQRVPEAHFSKAISVDDVMDLKGLTSSVQVLDGSVDLGMIFEKYESNVVFRHERDVHARRGDNKIRAYFLKQFRVDGSLAVLGGYDYQRLIVDALGFEGGDDAFEGGVNKI